MGSLETCVSSGGTTHEFGLILYEVSPQTGRLSTGKSIRGKGFEGIVKSKSGEFRGIGVRGRVDL